MSCISISSTTLIPSSSDLTNQNFMIIGLGSNLGDRYQNLAHALALLKQHFKWQGQSQIYGSAAVDYLDQPYFYNMVAQFALPALSPAQALKICLSIEDQLGRQRLIRRGPRNIDLDLLFWCTDTIDLAAKDGLPSTQIPHPRIWQRSFVFFLLQELPAVSILAQTFATSWAKALQELKRQDLQLIGPLIEENEQDK